MSSSFAAVSEPLPPDRIGRLHLLKVKGLEGFADHRTAADGEQKTPLKPGKRLGQGGTLPSEALGLVFVLVQLVIVARMFVVVRAVLAGMLMDMARALVVPVGMLVLVRVVVAVVVLVRMRMLPLARVRVRMLMTVCVLMLVAVGMLMVALHGASFAMMFKY